MRSNETTQGEVRITSVADVVSANLGVHGSATLPVDSYTDISYVEWAENPVQESMLIDRLNQNLKALEELQARHSFLMREVKYLLKV